MASRTWITCPGQFDYLRPYEDAWGTLHDPTTEWDELLKNCKPWLMLLQVGEGTRRMAQPASIGAGKMIHKEQKRHRQAACRINKLEAAYLEETNCRKHWKRRQKKTLKIESKAAAHVAVASGA